jgi:lactoylglutathione lyase
MAIESIQLTTIFVRDQDAALEFWEQRLGLEKRMDEAFGPGMRFLVVAPPVGPTGLVLQKAQPGEEGRVGGFTGIVFGTSDVEATHAELSGRGVSFTEEPKRQPWGATQALFVDPDGNVFVLHER